MAATVDPIAGSAELARSLLNRTTSTYNNIKRARRLLRAQTRQRGIICGLIMRSSYDARMMAINDVQLEIESLSDEIETLSDLFTAPRELKGLYKKLDDNLAKLITEYEERRPLFGSNLGRRSSNLPELAAFLDKDPFRDLSGPYHRVQETLRADLSTTFEKKDKGLTWSRAASPN